MKTIKIEIAFLIAVLLVGIAANTGTAYGYRADNSLYPYPYECPEPYPYPYSYEGPTACIIYVKWDATGVNDGSSWTDAYTDLQDAITFASSGDVIWVAAGTYKPTTGTNRGYFFELKNGVAILGGFAGTETLFTERDPSTNVTILSGDIGIPNDNSDNSYHVLRASFVSIPTQLDGFTITSGNATERYGGGMYNAYGYPLLANITFYNNSALSGGGMYSVSDGNHGHPILHNVTFSNNSATFGGGMWNESSDAQLRNVTFSGNSAVYGGGMGNHDSDPYIWNVTISGNSAATSGGGVYNEVDSNPGIQNVIIWGNSAPTGSQIYNDASIPTVSYSVIQGGYAGGTNIITADPKLGMLGDNGGFTQTIPLLAGSSAIDAGDACPDTDQRGVTRPQGSQCDIGAYEYELTVLQANFSSVASYDGWILESSETSNNGGTMNSSNSIFYLGDDAQNRQYRAILHFDTSSLPDNAVIVDAKLRLSTNEVVSGTNPFLTHDKIVIELNTGAYSTSSNLQLDDFRIPSNRNGAGAVHDNLVNGFYRGRLKGDVLEYFNLGGATQIRLRFKVDDDDDNVADLIEFYSGNASVSADRPRLVIYYYIR